MSFGDWVVIFVFAICFAATVSLSGLYRMARLGQKARSLHIAICMSVCAIIFLLLACAFRFTAALPSYWLTVIFYLGFCLSLLSGLLFPDVVLGLWGLQASGPTSKAVVLLRALAITIAAVWIAVLVLVAVKCTVLGVD